MSLRSTRTNHLILLAVSLAVAFVTTARADIINVPGDQPAIQTAINIALKGDEIIVAPGTYVETINFLGKAIIVRSTDPDDPTVVVSTIIDGNGAGSVVTCDSGEGPDSVLSGFVITGGSGTDVVPTVTRGGGMYNVNSSPTVTNCSFIGNTASFEGAGMYNENSSPTVTNCSFSGNWAFRDDLIHIQGGGMYNFNSSPMVTNCTFSANSVSAFDVCNPNMPGTPVAQGGGMYNLNGSPTMTDCSFIGNRASAASRVSTGNNVSAYGGGIYTSGGNLTLTNCTFSGNSTIGTGCGVALPSTGGGVFQGVGSMTVTSCTFIGNSVFAFGATGVPPVLFLRGGGIATGANTTITDSQFCGNAPDQINGPYNDGGGNEISMICPPVPDSCPGDLDGNGTVNTSDLLALFANWGLCK